LLSTQPMVGKSIEGMASQLEVTVARGGWSEAAKLAAELLQEIQRDEADIAAWMDDVAAVVAHGASVIVDGGDLAHATAFLDVLPPAELAPARSALTSLRADDAELALVRLRTATTNHGGGRNLVRALGSRIGDRLVVWDVPDAAHLALHAVTLWVRQSELGAETERLQASWALARGLELPTGDPYVALVRLCRRRSSSRESPLEFVAAAARLAHLVEGEPDSFAFAAACAESVARVEVPPVWVFYAFALRAIREGREGAVQERLEELGGERPGWKASYQRMYQRALERADKVASDAGHARGEARASGATRG
jgi:hypothetical protein